MGTLRRFLLRLANVLHPGRAEPDLAREVRVHLTMLEDEFRGRGKSVEEARLAAKRAFGGVEQAKERQRDARSFVWLEQLRQDLRHAMRSLARTPGFTTVVIVTLALGIGANTAIFSVIHSVLLKSLPYPDAERLVRLVEQIPAGETPRGIPVTKKYFTAAEADALARRARSLDGVATYNGAVLTMVGPNGATRLMGATCTPSLFQVLGARPILGRLFTQQDVAGGNDHVALLGYDLWQNAFAGDPHVLGRAIAVQALLGRSRPPESYTVIGVMPPGFRFLDPDTESELWTPYPAARRNAQGFVVGRLASGLSLSAAATEVGAILQAVRSGTRGGRDDAAGARRFELVGARHELVSPIQPALLVLALAAGFVLVIACVNVANLFLARAIARRQEIAIRVALGASRGRVVRHVLTESVLLAGFGGIAGIALAFGGVDLLRTLATTLSRIDVDVTLNFPRLNEIAVDGTALAFTAGVALASGIAFGLVAAVRVSTALEPSALRSSTSAGASEMGPLRRLRGRGVLVGTQTALTVTLLVTSALLLRSFTKLATVDPGYDPNHVLTFQVALPGYADARLERFTEDLLPRLRVIPGVQAAGAARTMPMVSLMDTYQVGTTPASPSDTGPVPASRGADIRPVSAGYFEALGMITIAGRPLTDADGPSSRALVINEALAHREFPNGNPLGRIVYLGHIPSPWTIVGVVKDAREFALTREPQPDVFVDARWISEFNFPPYPVGPYFIVRAADPTRALDAFRQAVRLVDPQASLINVASMNALISNSLSRPRLYAVWTGILAAMAVLLAAIGLYGVLAYAVEARTREIGVRRALGAQVGDVLGLVLRQTLGIASVGLMIGLAGAAALSGYLRGMLFGLTPLDPETYAAAAVAFLLVVALSACVPARRAVSVDPLVAIRCE